MSTSMHITGLNEVARGVSRLGSIQKQRALSIIAAEVESQTRRRIQVEKTDPQGKPWRPSNNSGGGSILQKDQQLLDSITSKSNANTAYIGSNVVYAAIHQFGGIIKPKDQPYLTFKIRGQWIRTKSVTIPRRQFLGISKANEQDIIKVLNEFIGRHIEQVFA